MKDSDDLDLDNDRGRAAQVVPTLKLLVQETKEMHAGSISGSGRSPGGRHGNPLQYSCVENEWTEEHDGLQSVGPQRV